MTPTDQAPAMTIVEAEQTIRHWQAQLQQATAAVAQHEQQLGQLALAGTADGALVELQALRDRQVLAEQALAAAHVQRGAAQQRAQQERLLTLRQQAAEAQAAAEAAAAIVDEWGPKVANARAQLVRQAQRAMALERQIENLEANLKEVTA